MHNKSLYAQQSYFVHTSRFERISRSHAKYVLYVRNKLLTCTRRTLYAQVASSAKVVYLRNKSFTQKSRIFYAKPLIVHTSRTIYVHSRYKRVQQINKFFKKKKKKILTISFPFLYLPSLASCTVNRSSPHNPVVTGPIKCQAHQHPSVSKT